MMNRGNITIHGTFKTAPRLLLYSCYVSPFSFIMLFIKLSKLLFIEVFHE